MACSTNSARSHAPLLPRAQAAAPRAHCARRSAARAVVVRTARRPELLLVGRAPGEEEAVRTSSRCSRLIPKHTQVRGRRRADAQRLERRRRRRRRPGTARKVAARLRHRAVAHERAASEFMHSEKAFHSSDSSPAAPAHRRLHVAHAAGALVGSHCSSTSSSLRPRRRHRPSGSRTPRARGKIAQGLMAGASRRTRVALGVGGRVCSLATRSVAHARAAKPPRGFCRFLRPRLQGGARTPAATSSPEAAVPCRRTASHEHVRRGSRAARTPASRKAAPCRRPRMA